MKTAILALITFMYSHTHSSIDSADNVSLTVKVSGLRNELGVVQFALYNKDGSIPDKDYEHYYKILKAEIINGAATVTFSNIPAGTYAVNVLHDENKDGKIDRGFVLPTEGVGFSNYQSIGLTNKPNFSKASFAVNADKTVSVKMIYM
jgi:uncharacterized protein (DUF2141 family)